MSQHLFNVIHNRSIENLQYILDNNPPKVISLLISAFVVILFVPIFCAIIWYERFGNDKKRTLIHQLFAFICWICAAYLAVGKTGDIFISIFAILLPTWFCVSHAFLKSLTSIALLLTVDLILVTRYFFIFWLQNPASVQDDFWCRFLSIWITGFSMATQFVYFFWPGVQPVHVYVCEGYFPSTDEELSSKTRWSAFFTFAVSVSITLVILIKIEFHKKKLHSHAVFIFRCLFELYVSIKYFFNQSKKEFFYKYKNRFQ
jgi:hypothetical protein